MSYIQDLIDRNRAEDAVFRAAYDEEATALDDETARRKTLMASVVSIRKQRGLTQRDVAERMKIPLSRVSLIERGEAPIEVDSLLRMLTVLRGSLAVIPEEEGRPSPSRSVGRGAA